VKEFPQAFPYGDPTNGGDIGMTLRDYFAAAVLPVVISARGIREKAETIEVLRLRLAKNAYEIADAMLAARELPSKELSK
jgi:hypothetical protein